MESMPRLDRGGEEEAMKIDSRSVVVVLVAVFVFFLLLFFSFSFDPDERLLPASSEALLLLAGGF